MYLYVRVTRLFVLLVALCAATPAAADPSAHTDVGLLCEIKFREGSSRLPPASGSQLHQVAAWANEHWNGLIVIDGHADRTGDAKENIRLSLRRARVVRNQLVALGVDPNQLVVSAFGPEDRTPPRVAVWGTRGSLESVTAARKRAQSAHENRARPSRVRRR